MSGRRAARQAAELDRGHTYAPKFHGAERRDSTRNRVREGALSQSRRVSAGTLQIVPKKTPDIPARIQIRVVYTLQIDR